MQHDYILTRGVQVLCLPTKNVFFFGIHHARQKHGKAQYMETPFGVGWHQKKPISFPTKGLQERVPTVRNGQEEHAQKNMDPGRAEAQYEASFCIEHNKNKLKNIQGGRLMTQELSGCTAPITD